MTSKQCFLLPAIFFGMAGSFATCLYSRKAPKFSIENFSELQIDLCLFFLCTILTLCAFLCLLSLDGVFLVLMLLEPGNELGVIKRKDLILCQYPSSNSFDIPDIFGYCIPLQVASLLPLLLLCSLPSLTQFNI